MPRRHGTFASRTAVIWPKAQASTERVSGASSSTGAVRLAILQHRSAGVQLKRARERAKHVKQAKNQLGAPDRGRQRSLGPPGALGPRRPDRGRDGDGLKRIARVGRRRAAEGWPLELENRYGDSAVSDSVALRGARP